MYFCSLQPFPSSCWLSLLEFPTSLTWQQVRLHKWKRWNGFNLFSDLNKYEIKRLIYKWIDSIMILSIATLFTCKIQTTTHLIQIQSDLVWQLPESSSISFGCYCNHFEVTQHTKKLLKQHIIHHACKPSTNHKPIWKNWVSNDSPKKRYISS